MGTLSPVGTCTVVLHNDNAVVNSSLTGTVASLQRQPVRPRLRRRRADASRCDYTITVTHP